MKIYLALFMHHPNQSLTLNRCKKKERLVSFLYIRLTKTSPYFTQYAKFGVINRRDFNEDIPCKHRPGK